MAMQYWVGNFYIDLSRNQITQKELTQTLAPKALAVLTYLAQHQGKVVSYDDLLSNVWPDTIVTPNTLQRSIAQLRKALGEDSKIQSYIKTHAKQGYSLECEVQWQVKVDSNDSSSQETVKNLVLQSASSEAENQATPKSNDDNQLEITTKQQVTQSNDKPARQIKLTTMLGVMAGIVIFSVIAFKFFTPKQVTNITFDTLKPFTATKNKEFGASYTHDGKYVIFHRYLNNYCGNRIWARNIESQQETLLTKDWSTYGHHSLSKDGKSLTFIETEQCSKPISQQSCYNLMQLDLTSALQQPASPNVLMQCENSKIKKPTWLDNNDIALLQQKNDHWQLTRYSVNENKSQVIYSVKNGNIHHYDYSEQENLISIFNYRNDSTHYIDIIKPDGSLVSSNQITYPADIAKFRLIYPRFLPNTQQLIFSTGRQLFTMSYEGKITKANIPLDESVGSPRFHPNGNKILLIKGRYDSDIYLTPREQITASTIDNTNQQNRTESELNSKIIEQTVFSEDYATFQPNGKLIAYISRRTSEDQLWITGDNGARQLSRFPMDTYIKGLYWSDDGNSILVNSNNRLIEIDLSGHQKIYDLDFPIKELFQWHSAKNTALLIAHIEGKNQFIELNLQTKTLTHINDKTIIWAQVSEDGQLIYKDHMHQYWQPGPAEDKLIEPLLNQGDREQFVIADNIIYGLNKEKQLWSYDLNLKAFTLLKNMNENVDYITDINQSHFLITHRAWAKKEVVELSLNK